MFELGIETHVLTQIIDGRKTVEGRLRKGKFLHLQVGGIISLREDQWKDGAIVRSIPQRARVIITELQYYPSFTAMMQDLGHDCVLPDADNIEEALQVYYQFYSPEDEAAYGVVAVNFELDTSFSIAVAAM